MPCTKKPFDIDTSKPVLVTGATGYIAGVLIHQLLDKGVTVHATVRDPSKKDRLQYLQDLADKSSGSIKFFKANLTDSGSFEEAMQGCYAVFHTASPFTGNFQDAQKELIEPAVQGTKNVLLTCNKVSSVKRVVVTSSCAAVITDCWECRPDVPTDENTWNRTTSLTRIPYCLSKTMAEQAAWTIAGSQTQWRLCTINPSLVIGPGVKYHASSESFTLMKSLGSKDDPNNALGVANLGLGVVDVRDVASAHIAAAYLDDAGGRYICSAHNTSLPELAQSIGNKYYPEYPIVMRTIPNFLMPLIWLLAPYTGQGIDRTFVRGNWGYKPNFDHSKMERELGMEFRPLNESIQEMFQQFIDNKAIQPCKK